MKQNKKYFKHITKVAQYTLLIKKEKKKLNIIINILNILYKESNLKIIFFSFKKEKGRKIKM